MQTPNITSIDKSVPCVHKAYALIALNLGVADKSVILNGLSATSLSNSVERLSLGDVLHLVRNVEKATDNRFWPILLGERLGTSSHGVVGAASLSAATVGEAVATFAKWFKLRCNVYDQSLDVTDALTPNGNVTLNIKDTTGDALFARVFFQAFAKAIESFIEQLNVPLNAGDSKIEFKREYGHQPNELCVFYKSAVYCDAAENRITINAQVWSARNPLSDPTAFNKYIQECQQLASGQTGKNRQAMAVDEHVRAIIHAHFLTIEQSLATERQFEPQNVPSLTQLCTRLNTTERTLIRQLKALGTSYKLIVMNEKKQLAAYLLVNTPLTIQRISEALDYNEVANFCRVFKQWFGVTPSVFRTNNSY